MKDRSASARIQMIANNIRPKYSSRGRHHPIVPGTDGMSSLYDAIEQGQADLVVKSPTPAACLAKTKSRADETIFTSFVDLVSDSIRRLKEQARHLRAANYYILESTQTIDESSSIVPVVIDESSVMHHTTGWRAWDDPFEIAVFGVLKGLVAFRAAQFAGLGNSSLAAGALAGQSELITMQYCANGKSIVRKAWYGSYGLRYNLRSLEWEIPWVDFAKCGPPERTLVELTRRDRVVNGSRPIPTGDEGLVGAFVRMADYLNAFKDGPQLPERSTRQPIRG